MRRIAACCLTVVAAVGFLADCGGAGGRSSVAREQVRGARSHEEAERVLHIWDAALTGASELRDRQRFLAAMKEAERAMKLKHEFDIDDEDTTGYEVYSILEKLMEAGRTQLLLPMLLDESLVTTRSFVIDAMTGVLDLAPEVTEELHALPEKEQVELVCSIWESRFPSEKNESGEPND